MNGDTPEAGRDDTSDGAEGIGPSDIPEESVASESELSLSHQVAQRESDTSDE